MRRPGRAVALPARPISPAIPTPPMRSSPCSPMQLSPAIRALVRRAILDLVDDVGGELTDEVVTISLNELGHRIARAQVRDEIMWLAGENLLTGTEQGPFLVVRSTSTGRDVAQGLLRIDGVSRHKTGE